MLVKLIICQIKETVVRFKYTIDRRIKRNVLFGLTCLMLSIIHLLVKLLLPVTAPCFQRRRIFRMLRKRKRKRELSILIINVVLFIWADLFNLHLIHFSPVLHFK